MAYGRLRNLRPGGFTLEEILIVVVIMGILVAIVVASVGDAMASARRSMFASNVKSYSDAAMMYITQTERFPEDSSSGDCPAGFETYIDCDEWEGGTAIGGVLKIYIGF